MEPHPVVDSILASMALTGTIFVLGALFLLILRGPKFQCSLRFLILSIGCLAVVIGLWTALLRNASRPVFTGEPGIDADSETPFDAIAPREPVGPGNP
jgi:hypothetical protein